MLLRFLVVWAYTFWMGGFLFYGSIVVPVGTEVLGSARDQGWISRSVMLWFQPIGFFAVGVLAYEAYRTPDPDDRRWRRWLCDGLSCLLLVALTLLHESLSSRMNPLTHEIELDGFASRHRWYLRLLTALWCLNTVRLFWMLRAWQAADRQSIPPIDASVSE